MGNGDKMIGYKFKSTLKGLWADMQFVTNYSRRTFQTNFLPKKRINCDKLRFPKKKHELYFHIININTQGYITLNKYIICIDSIGLAKVSLWATKFVNKRP